MQKENKSHILFRDVYYRVFVFTELFCLHEIKYSFPCFFFFFFFLNRTGSSDQPLCAQISGNVGEKKKAPEEKSYREDRGLIRGWRREGWTEAVRGCGCYRYLAWCQVKAQPICIYSDDGCSLSPPSLSLTASVIKAAKQPFSSISNSFWPNFLFEQFRLNSKPSGNSLTCLTPSC